MRTNKTKKKNRYCVLSFELGMHLIKEIKVNYFREKIKKKDKELYAKTITGYIIIIKNKNQHEKE